jgi:hypothetical protein
MSTKQKSATTAGLTGGMPSGRKLLLGFTKVLG